MNGKKPVERRKHKRFQVPSGTFVALFPDYIKAGQVSNISMGGLAFTYFADQEPPNRSFELEILLHASAFNLQGVPFRTISDFETEDVPLSSTSKRRCAVQFGHLTPHQMSQLEYLIQNYAVGEAT